MGASVINDNTEILQLVTFMIGNEEYGVDILFVHEINRTIQITRVPNTPSFVDGVVNLRGKIIPIVNLRKKLGLDKKRIDNDTRIIVIEMGGTIIGFVVDKVKEVLRVPSGLFENPPDITNGANSEYIKAVGKLDDRLLLMIDLEKVFTNNEAIELKQAV